MPQYVFWYDDSSTYKAGFTASNLEEAQQLIDRVVVKGEMLLEELPNFWSKHKANEIEVGGDLEEID